ncbi:MAG: hypothetical protein OGM15_02800 [Lachnospiraceae bacterium]|nr:MAG: hypothetical protein OGM15_02800 [Lachnospiraceae bacterium]
MKKIKQILCIICVLGLLTGCGGKQNKTEKKTYRQELSEEEMSNGHASFDIDDKFKVDADLTKPEVYKDGMKSYYMNQYKEKIKGTSKKFTDNPTVFNRTQKEMEKTLNKLIPGKLSWKRINRKYKNDPYIEGAYKSDDGDKYKMRIVWDTYDDVTGNSDTYFCPSFYMRSEKSDKEHIAALKIGIDEDIDGIKTDYTDKIEKNVGTYKKAVEKLIGRKINDEYRMYSLNAKSAKIINDVRSIGLKYNGKQYDLLAFYKDVDNLKFSDIDPGYQVKADEKPDKWAKTTSAGNDKLSSMWETPVYLVFCEGKLEHIEADSFRETGSVYKNTQKIISPNKPLKEVIKFYEKKLLVEEVKIKSIELKYIAYYASDSSKTVKPIITPAWVVGVYDNDESIEKIAYFCYDGYTGECYGNEIISW